MIKPRQDDDEVSSPIIQPPDNVTVYMPDRAPLLVLPDERVIYRRIGFLEAR